MTSPSFKDASTSPSETGSPVHEDPDPILCVGEVLWDALPEGLFLGGALFNVAAHLHALHEPSILVSRVGGDALGEEVLRRMRNRGMTTDLVQIDPDRRTGIVRVVLDDEGFPDYTIAEPVAWDAIAWTDDLADYASSARAVVIGTLAQRKERSRQTIRTLCETTEGLVVLDVNLRPPHADSPVVEESLRSADVVKLNEEELKQLQRWFALPTEVRASIRTLSSRFHLRACCVTRGADGALLWTNGAWSRHPGYPVEVKNTVGAGDAFLSAFLSGWLVGTEPDPLLELANRLGAYVASHTGAQPDYEVDTLEAIHDLPLENSPRTT